MPFIIGILWQEVPCLNAYLADHILIGYYHEDDEVLRSLSPEAESNIRLNSNSGQSSKRNSCACRKCSLFNFDDCDPKEATTVIKYLRFRKVYIYIYMVFKIIIFWKYLCHVEFINKMLTMSLLTYLYIFLIYFSLNECSIRNLATFPNLNLGTRYPNIFAIHFLVSYKKNA